MTKEVRLDIPGEEWQLRLHRHDYGERSVHQAVLSHRTMEMLVKVSIKRAIFDFYAALEPHSPRSVDQDPIETITEAVVEKLTDTPTVLTITGRSGSGKSTLAEQVSLAFTEHGISSTILSADDYNRGRTGLRELFGHDNHTNWDAHYVYDTALLARHIEGLKSGVSAPQYVFDFKKSERFETGDMVEPAQVIIVEGIMANSPNLTSVADLSYLMPTPLATCIGRRALRDKKENRGGAIGNDTETFLQYQLHVAEPEYRARLQV